MQANKSSQKIIELFQKYGHIEYGEGCSQLSHAMQAGLIAKEKGYDEELIVAAFLHDIGHLYPLEIGDSPISTMGDFGIDAHDQWGDKCLQLLGFPERIIATVKNHVASKRYLCFAEKGYYDQLSTASKKTLEYQSGPMNRAEADLFKKVAFFEDSILIRKIDDEAKAIDFEISVEDWSYFSELLERFSTT